MMTKDEAQNRIWQAGEALVRRGSVPTLIRVGKYISDAYLKETPTRLTLDLGGDSVDVNVVFDSSLGLIEVIAEELPARQDAQG